MKVSHLLLMTIFVFCFCSLSAQHQETKYNTSDNTELPDWVQLMYSDEADPGEVKTLYDEYYLAHDFVKNQDTQYYKHWMRNIARDVNGLFWNDGNINKEKILENEAKYLERRAFAKNTAVAGTNWECIGPIDYDHDAAGRSYAPGSGHVYTVEQSVTDANMMWAGTATAGVYKSTDYGLNWTPTTDDLPLTGCRALAIDHTNANIVYFSASGDLYKTTDAGASWAVVGDAVFNSEDRYANDIVMHPTLNNILFICADNGLFRTVDSGANFTQVKGGEWQEMEFHPTDNTIVYAVKQNGDHTEFYKSIDSGITWTMKGNGWPGIASSSSTTFNALENTGGTSDYISFASNPNLGDGANADFTIEFRIKSASWTGDPSIISNKNWASGSNAGFVVAANGSGWKFNIGDGTTRIDLDGNAINDNEWHHLAISYDQDGTKTLYQDGAQVSTSTDVLANSTATTLALALLQDGTLSYGDGLNARVSDVRIWSTALDAATIKNQTCSAIDNTHPNYSDLLHYWKIDENTGTTITDSKGSNNGTANGSNIWTTGNIMTCNVLSLGTNEHQRRTEIAVSPADPNLVIAQASGAVNGGTGLFGIYKSIDAGETWTFSCCGTQPGGPASSSNTNFMGYSDAGDSDGGQYYYDMALDISKTNADHISVAGVQRWETLDGGLTWSCPAKWSHPHKSTYIHADIHDLRYLPNGDIWVACDGGIYYSDDNGASFSRRMYGIAGTDFWGFGAGFQDGDVMVGGTYHNSTLLKDGDTYTNGWISTAIGGAGGDNVRGYVNPGKEKTIYMDAGKRVLPGDRNIGFTDYSFAQQTNSSYITGEDSDMLFHPTNPNIIYTSTENALWKTEDDGGTFTMIHDFGEQLAAMDICFLNPDVMYVATYPGWWDQKNLYKTTDAGATWTQLSFPFTSQTWAPLDVVVDAENPLNVWIARTPQSGGYNSLDAAKVYYSEDGGANWTNWTTSILDGEHATNITLQRGTNGGIYLGTRRTVYYRNRDMTDWALYSNGLPAYTYSTRLIPYYNENKLRNGTSRSVWEVDLFETSSTLAQMSADKLDVYCAREPVQFYDRSTALTGATYAWSFPGATPATSSDRNPTVVFGIEGTYDVTLTVTDAHGTDTQTLTNFITVHPSDCTPENVPDMALSPGTTGYVNLGRPDNLDFNGTESFTFSAWIKPSVDNMNGYIISKFDRFVTGQFFLGLEDGKLVVHREVSPWDAVTTTSLVAGKWYHAVGTYDGSQMKVYLNGELESTVNMTGSISSSNRDILIGARYKNGIISDFFEGAIDEVEFWKRALTQDEIRQMRHLTLDQVSDTDLVGYFQFNEDGTTVYDRGQFNNGTIGGNATRSTSTAPVGGGESFKMDITTGGEKVFTDTDLTLTFPTGGTNPDGELVATRIDLNPDQMPNVMPAGDTYWIVNNYGNNANFDALESIKFGDIAITEGQDASAFKLYKRNSNDDLATWGTSLDFADAITAGASGDVTFSADNGITSFSQFVVVDESAVLPVDWLYFRAALTEKGEVQLDWATVNEQNNKEFEVERSSNGQDFEVIGKVTAQMPISTTLTYQIFDENPLRGKSYYRLRQVDLDGTSQFSKVRTIVFEALPNHFAVFPNPIAANDDLQIVSDLNEDLKVQVYNAKGRLVVSTTVVGGIGSVSMQGLSSGAYLYKIIGSEKMKMGKVMVE